MTTPKTKRIALFSTLLVVALLILGLYDLAHAPYRPPHDMSTLLGGPELQVVWTLIGLLTIAWLGVFLWFVSTFIHKKS
jgi:hypothetical protein